MSKHTPGPWSIRESRRGDYFIDAIDYHDDTGMLCEWKGLAKVYVTESEEGTECEGKANARLISAAPELYEALVEAIKCRMVPETSASEGGAARHSRQVQVADMIRAAIAKAEGKE